MTLRRRHPVPVKEAPPSLSASCAHPAVLNSLCVACGAFIRPSNEEGHSAGAKESASSLTMTGGQQLKFLSDEAVLDQQKEKAAGLHGARKLALILDLDHTLIHTTAVDHPPADVETLNADNIHHLGIDEKVEGIGTITKHYIVKKRPHLDTFLLTAYEQFQMTIYTAGTRKYAAAVANMMDPTGKLFSGRIVSRSDIPNDKHAGLEKSLARLFLGDSSMAMIVDDREDVWKGEQGRQLYVVRPFVHFKGAHEVNNTAGNTSSEDRVISMIHTDKPADSSVTVDDQLLRTLQVAQELHEDYYNDYDKLVSESSCEGSDEGNEDSVGKSAVVSSPATTTAPLPSSLSNRLVFKKKKVLEGCVITFSGLIPINEKNPAEKCLLWRLVISLGGQVCTEISDRTTHLVTTHLDSKKVTDSQKRGNVWIMHPDWLLYSRWAVQKASEVTFTLIGVQDGQDFPNPTLDATPLPEELSRPLIASNSTSDSDSPSQAIDESSIAESGKKRSRDDMGIDSDEEDAEFRKSLGKIHKKSNARHAHELEAAATARVQGQYSDADVDKSGSDSDNDAYGGFDDAFNDD